MVLASGSAARAQILRQAGLHFSVAPSDVDEEALQARLPEASPEQLAAALARAKALNVAVRYPEHLTIGCDQICALPTPTPLLGHVDFDVSQKENVENYEIFSKPGSAQKAREQLERLAGRTHYQLSGLCVAQAEQVLFETVGKAALTLRDLSEAEIAAYVAAEQPLKACGAYHYEALGKHLFAEVVGANEVIQGLPIQPLLAWLYAQGHLALC